MTQPADRNLPDRLRERLWRALLFAQHPRRDRALLALLLYTTCTPREAIELREEDVDLGSGRVRWRRAGREVWEELPSEAVAALRDYRRQEHRGGEEGRRFFTSRLGHPLSPAQVVRLFRFLERETGLRGLNPVTLRAMWWRACWERAPRQVLATLRRSRAAP